MNELLFQSWLFSVCHIFMWAVSIVVPEHRQTGYQITYVRVSTSHYVSVSLLIKYTDAVCYSNSRFKPAASRQAYLGQKTPSVRECV